MSRHERPGRMPAPLLAAACWVLCFSLACAMAARAPSRDAGGAGVLENLAGSLRAVAATGFVERADAYFHRGVGHDHDHDGHGVRGAFFRRWHARLSPADHDHLEDREAAEMLPWLLAAAELDPDDVETWLTAAYWVERAGGASDRVRSVFAQARRAHPGNYRIPDRMAGYRLRRGEWAAAEALLALTVRLWPEGEAEEDFARRDLAHALVRWGLLREMAGDPERAAELYRQALRVRPGHRVAAERLEVREHGASQPGEAREVLARLAAAEAAPEHGGCHAH